MTSFAFILERFFWTATGAGPFPGASLARWLSAGCSPQLHRGLPDPVTFYVIENGDSGKEATPSPLISPAVVRLWQRRPTKRMGKLDSGIGGVRTQRGQPICAERVSVAAAFSARLPTDR